MTSNFRIRATGHGRTHPPNGFDITRSLTEEGREQAFRAGIQLDGELERPDILLISPTVRTRATAEIMFQKERPADVREFPIYPYPSLEKHKALWEMFRAVGDQPLGIYKTHPDFHLLEAFAEEAADELEKILGDRDLFVVLVGHPVLDQALIRAIVLRFDNEAAAEEVEGFDPHECDSINLVIEDNAVSRLELIRLA